MEFIYCDKYKYKIGDVLAPNDPDSFIESMWIIGRRLHKCFADNVLSEEWAEYEVVVTPKERREMKWFGLRNEEELLENMHLIGRTPILNFIKSAK
jgi:hypothetical protein